MIDIGSVINGKYRLVRVLGDGGMGSVYEALHLSLGTRVAVKVLHPELARRTGLVERFLQEARVAAQIRSPHVVQVTDVDRTPEGYAYIVMELLEGEPLSSVLDRQHKLSVTIACAYTTQILQALEAAHALGVIHRDLKPENVFVTFAGGKPVLKLIDFGIAKARPADQQQKRLTVAGVVMGTAEYMAPEQARSADAVDARADIYAVGVMLYEMLAGARPVGGTDARIIALKVERGEVIPLLQAAPEMPREIAGLVHRAMAPRPEMRFATATEMRLAVEAGATGKRPSTAAMGSARAAGGTLEITGRAGATPAPSPPPAVAQPPLRLPATPSEHEPAVVTIRAPPIATALAPAYVGPAVPAFSAPGTTAHRSSGRRWIVAVLALLAVVSRASSPPRSWACGTAVPRRPRPRPPRPTSPRRTRPRAPRRVSPRPRRPKRRRAPAGPTFRRSCRPSLRPVRRGLRRARRRAQPRRPPPLPTPALPPSCSIRRRFRAPFHFRAASRCRPGFPPRCRAAFPRLCRAAFPRGRRRLQLRPPLRPNRPPRHRAAARSTDLRRRC